MNRNCLPPLLRGIGTTILLFATVFSVIAARRDLRTDRIKREAVYARARADAEAQVVAARNLAGLEAAVEDLRSGMQEESVAGEVIENPWFDWGGLVGTAIIASSFYVESFQRRREKISS